VEIVFVVILVILIVFLLVLGDDIVAGDVYSVGTLDLEENLLALANDNIDRLLVVLLQKMVSLGQYRGN